MKTKEEIELMIADHADRCIPPTTFIGRMVVQMLDGFSREEMKVVLAAIVATTMEHDEVQEFADTVRVFIDMKKMGEEMEEEHQ